MATKKAIPGQTPAPPNKRAKTANRPVAAGKKVASPDGRSRARNAAKTAVAKPTAPAKASKSRKPAAKPATKSAARAKPKSKSSGRKKRSPLLAAQDVDRLFEAFWKADPDPKGELEHSNPFTLLVAVVLSAQATDAGVNKATRELFRLADTPQKMVALGEDRVRDLVKSIGLFRTKAKNVVLLSQQLIDQFGGEVPHDRDTLETLPGVGRKTANVVMNVAFGEPTMAVDTHVLRLSNRIGLSRGTTPLAVEQDLLACIPERFGVPAHHWLPLHGRYICKARKPECGRCHVRDICLFPDKTDAS